MTMRAPAGRTKTAHKVDLAEFGWKPSLIATARHSTLPWYADVHPVIDLPGVTALTDMRGWGARDRLSLTGQYAAHLSFLRRLGVVENEFDPADWVALRKRGSDVRLIRIRALDHHSDGRDGAAPLSLIQNFSELVEAKGLKVLSRSWSNSDAAYSEILVRLVEDAASDLSWLRTAAVGSNIAPHSEAFELLFERPGVCLTFRNSSALESASAIRRIDPKINLFVIGIEASPLRAFSALSELMPPNSSRATVDENDFANDFVSRFQGHHAVLAVASPQLFDRDSQRIIRALAERGGSFSWLAHESALDLIAPIRPLDTTPPTTFSVVAPTLEMRRRVEEQVAAFSEETARKLLKDFVESDELVSLEQDGEIPAILLDRPLTLEEPKRSYLAALAIMGDEIPRVGASKFLDSIGCQLRIEQLALDSVTYVDERIFRFADPNVRAQLERTIPPQSRAALARLGASLMTGLGEQETIRRAILLNEGGNVDRALSLLENEVSWKNLPPDAVVSALRRMPEELIGRSEILLRELADGLLATGAYLELKRLAIRFSPAERQLTWARAERRLGGYEEALRHLSEIASSDETFDSLLLASELLRVSGKPDEARARLTQLHALEQQLEDDDERRERLIFEDSLLTLEAGEKPAEAARLSRPYFNARVAFYQSVAAREYEMAISFANESIEASESIGEKIDATLDLVYALFMSGAWDLARREALRGLALTEETEGDRGAGGFLFTYGYLCADEGLWGEASDSIERLRRFYDSTGDLRRVSEIDLLAAQLFLGKGDLLLTRRYATLISGGEFSPDILSAANLILDEADWIEGKVPVQRKGVHPLCQELIERERISYARGRSRIEASATASFNDSIAAFELARLKKSKAIEPQAATRSEKLRFFRSLTGLSQRISDADVLEHARLLAAELGITRPVEAGLDSGSKTELAVLRALAEHSFPFDAETFGDLRWRFASRNRLGHWTQWGSLPPLENSELENRDEGDKDWIECGDAALLYIKKLGGWSKPSRMAVANLFQLRSEHYRLQRMIDQETEMASTPVRNADPMEGMVGDSAPLRELAQLVARVARRDVPICILGESGTGKELIARGIHRSSSRRGKVFTAVNCAALPETLIESELFGHVRGAFTGADRDRAGLIETTDGGTLFLDEVGELPMTAQAKLLRVLQEGEFRRVGDTANRSADVRIVAATNRKLERAVDDGRFREDLYYRIRGVELNVPPLRERGGDVLLLARHFLAEEKQKHRAGPDRLSPDTEALFTAYHWPGNVRELQNTIRGAHAVAGDAREVEIEHLPERLQSIVVPRSASGTYYEELVRFRKALVERSLIGASGNQNKAAQALGMSRQALGYQIRELGILVKELKA
ncbi:MAG TPA: sigma 54-interacting transcriptional regulator [Thermoanaerobaculia bacterium]|nr:sigma 54-interacting transcriptional regulator [Thermoanaerobaculia bacterium]